MNLRISSQRFYSLGILMPIALLCSISLLTLFSLKLQGGTQLGYDARLQAIYILLGLLVMLVVIRFGDEFLREQAGWIYLVTLLILAGLPFLADPVNGATRWYDLGSFQFQPSELAKLSIILILARLFTRRRSNHNKLAILFLSGSYAALIVGLIMIQPDLGTAVLVAGIWAGMLLISRLPKQLLFGGLLFVLVAGWLGIPQLADYQRSRLEAFLNPFEDPLGASYNSRQAMIAIGSGQLLGRGLDAGSQSQLLFLPAKHTDFIFATIAEKLGFIGAGLVIVCLALLVLSLFYLASKAPSHFASYCIAGVGLLIGLQSIVNIGMNLGLLPVTGIPLPFVSYGGSHMIIMFAAVGMAISLTQQNKPLSFEA